VSATDQPAAPADQTFDEELLTRDFAAGVRLTDEAPELRAEHPYYALAREVGACLGGATS
jgi:hypothetical protein